MAVGIITGNAGPQPKNDLNSEVLAQGLFDLFTSEAGIAVRFSRHDSVVSSPPAPLTSMEPPSNTIGTANRRNPSAGKSS